jgi:hypothetical protein
MFRPNFFMHCIFVSCVRIAKTYVAWNCPDHLEMLK